MRFKCPKCNREVWRTSWSREKPPRTCARCVRESKERRQLRKLQKNDEVE